MRRFGRFADQNRVPNPGVPRPVALVGTNTARASGPLFAVII